MEKQFELADYGTVIIRNAMFESFDGTTLDEGIEIKSVDGNFDLIELNGYYHIDEMNNNYVTTLINEYN